MQQACAGKEVVGLTDFSIAKDVVVMATPEIAGLPFVITGLVGAGGIAAALSTADGLLLAMAAVSLAIFGLAGWWLHRTWLQLGGQEARNVGPGGGRDGA